MLRQKLLLGGLLLGLGGLHGRACNAVTGADDVALSEHGAGGSGGAATTSSSTSATSATSTTSTGASATSASASAAASTGSGTTDPFEQNRQDCIAKIAALRATKGLPPFARWQSVESCVDEQATHDEFVNTPHDAFMNGTPSCGGLGQGECPKWGAGNITGCLEQMWAEGTQAGCSGCDACDLFTIYQGNCPNCIFNSQTTVCGHYVLLSSAMLTSAACGFSTDGSWAAIDYQ